jgi:peptidoglycan/xylan/chitin deacetylase (PgdA/CDA1 family)
MLVRTKRFVGLLISAAFLVLAMLVKAARRVSAKGNPGTCVVLYYHGVRREHRQMFARQMDVLLGCARPTEVSRKEPLSPGVHHAAVTFDDGYESVVENALPELEERRIPATVFVVTGALGKHPSWLTDPNDSAGQEKVLSIEQVQGLSPNLVAVGSHTMTHPFLPALNEDDAKREISASRDGLEGILKKEIRLFSFPFGALNPRLIRLCRESGYERVFTIAPTFAFSDPQEFVTGRVSVEPTDWPLEFRLKLMGAYRWQPVAFSLKRKLLSLRPLKHAPGRKTAVNLKSSSSSGV